VKRIYRAKLYPASSPPRDKANAQPSAGAEIEQYRRGTDACGRSTTAGNFEPAALTSTCAVALKHSNYCLQCYSHVTTANYSSGHADTFDDIRELHLRPIQCYFCYDFLVIVIVIVTHFLSF